MKKKLEFEDGPDYNFIKKIIVKRNSNSINLSVFSWIKLNYLKKKIISKESLQNRIYQIIKLNLEKKNLSYFDDSRNDLYQKVCSEANIFRKNEK